ncbi:LuxE/PaaK family acyltransferase [Marinirhabdus gelatinilytica]|uniref:Acyl-protein synthetase LuxE n=1 Tax=Marinirhabdus gelatinilytica TaxID=1703343 RepID=A0A370QKE6_9FLAO|nr:acyl transferase [Marinirhabdus gelatinilytica]RDK88843.1 acyl-protein synthetase LuxE [Marinirhabdus gelatinilytica]
MRIPSHFSTISSESDFNKIALETFQFQYANVAVYRRFCELLKVDPSTISGIEKIPFLPIQFFKSEKIIAQDVVADKTFSSSGTTGSVTSKHYVAKISTYEESFLKGFQQFYGSPQEYVFLALLPSYLERGGSSLVYMADRLIAKSNSPHSGFYLNNLDALIEKVKQLETNGQKTILLGVSYALLDVIEMETFNLQHTIVMETGGMKGRRKELTKTQLHNNLKQGFGVEKIHSEYGMTELLSQAYSTGDGIYQCPPWMKVITRDTEDPFTYIHKKTGGLNIIDLANTYSCSFIATQDLGRLYPNNTFEVMGRFDTSDIRGCNLMVL